MAEISFNRFGNATNPHQNNHIPRVLCVCSAGLLRSPTAAWILSNPPFNYNTRAVGVSEDFALIPLDAVHIHWADEIVVMSANQADVVKQMEADSNAKLGRRAETPVHILNVPDMFAYRDPELIKILDAELRRVFHIK